MAFTDDGWKTVKLGVGESVFYNPFTKQYELKYGIQASVIVGELLCEKNVFIGNEDGSVQITGNGITISNGVIQSADYNESEGTGSIIDLSNGSFSFADGGLMYQDAGDTEDGKKKLSVKGDIEATSIFAHNSYKLFSNGEMKDVLYAFCDTAHGATWSVILRLNEYAYVHMMEENGIDMNLGRRPCIMDIVADTIKFNGNV